MLRLCLNNVIKTDIYPLPIKIENQYLCLCNAHKLEEKPAQFEGKQFERLFEIARISNFTSEELSEYEASRMSLPERKASLLARPKAFCGLPGK